MSTPTAPPHKQVGDYAYRPDGDRVGRGSFATVYKARRLKDGERVAIKRINIVRLKKRLKENLELEINIMKRMHHPNIVKLFDTLESAQHMYLVMEYCDNGDLAKYIAKNKPLSESVVKQFAQQIASALLHLGLHNIIHRDIKPQNVLLQSTSSGEIQCKVADFGFARYLESELAATLCGSPLYMAPEILDSQPYGRKADLWSVGTVLYECLTGRPPFKASNYIELSSVIKTTCANLPMPPGISPALADLLRRVLQRDPEHRISVDDFFQHLWLDLEAYHRTIQIGPDDEPEEPFEAAFTEMRSPLIVAEAEPAPQPDVFADAPPRKSPPLSVVGPVVRRRHITSEASVTSGHTPPSVHLPAGMAGASSSLLSASPPIAPPFALPAMDSSRQLAHRATTPNPISLLSPPSSHHLLGSSASGKQRLSQPSVNPFKLPRRASTTALSGAVSEVARDPGDSYVMVDKDAVEVNAFADAVEQKKRAPSATQALQRQTPMAPSSAPMSTSAPASSRMTSFANALNAATTFTTQRLFNVPQPSYAPAASGSPAQHYSEEAVAQDIEDHIRQAASIMWLASKYDDTRQMRSGYMSHSGSSSYSSPPSQPSQAQGCALALYVRALKQYRRGMDAVKAGIPQHASVSPTLNIAVQKLRDKYNACLELAETVKSRMLATSSYADFRSAPRPNADMLLYDASMRLCREAATCELMPDYSPAERQYKHAFNILAAMLTNDIEQKDKVVLQQYIRNVYKRLEAIRQKRSTTSTS